MSNKDLDEKLNFDSLHEAEKISGKSYKDDEDTSFLGLALSFANSREKNAMLDSLGDSKLSNKVENYLGIVKSIGFEEVLVEPFTTEEGIDEKLYILWNNDLGILLKFDSYSYKDDGSWAKSGKEVPEPSVNGGNIYYNVKLKPRKEVESNCTSSGGYRDGVWVGNHDCREAIKHKIDKLKRNGEFLPKWVERPFLWLLHHGDTQGEYDYDEINEERISKLPKHVIDAITPEEK